MAVPEHFVLPSGQLISSMYGDQGVGMTVVKCPTLKYTDAIVALETENSAEWDAFLKKLGVRHEFDIHDNIVAIKQAIPGLAHRMLVINTNQPNWNDTPCVTRYVCVVLNYEDPTFTHVRFSEQNPVILDVVPRIVQPVPLFLPKDFMRPCYSATGMRVLYLPPELQSLNITADGLVLHNMNLEDLQFLRQAQINMLPYKLVRFNFAFQITGEGIDAPPPEHVRVPEATIIADNSKVYPRLQKILDPNTHRLLLQNLSYTGRPNYYDICMLQSTLHGLNFKHGFAGFFKNLHYAWGNKLHQNSDLAADECVLLAPKTTDDEKLYWVPHGMLGV